MTEEVMGCIYGLRDPRNDEIRYVGATIRPDSRYTQHKSKPVNGDVKEWYDELREDDAFPPEMDVLEEAPKKELADLELEYINEYQDDGDLLNIQISNSYTGESTVGRKSSADSLTILQMETRDIQDEIRRFKKRVDRYDNSVKLQERKLVDALADIRECHLRVLELLDGVEYVKSHSEELSEQIDDELDKYRGPLIEDYDPHNTRGDS